MTLDGYRWTWDGGRSLDILDGNRSFIAALLDRPTGDRSDEQAHGRSPGSRAYRLRRLPGSRSSGVRRRHAADSRGGGHGSAKPTVFPFHPLRQRDRTRWMFQLRGAFSTGARGRRPLVGPCGGSARRWVAQNEVRRPRAGLASRSGNAWDPTSRLVVEGRNCLRNRETTANLLDQAAPAKIQPKNICEFSSLRGARERNSLCDGINSTTTGKSATRKPERLEWIFTRHASESGGRGSAMKGPPERGDTRAGDHCTGDTPDQTRPASQPMIACFRARPQW